MAWRYIAQRALTNEWLDWDVPITRDTLTWDLSGPGQLSGTLSPEIGSMHAADGKLLLEEWGTFLYAENDGIIRWGGVVVSSAFNGADWKIECVGFSGYPKGIPYTGEWRKTNVDTLDCVREIWRHIQSFPDGEVGMAVSTAKSGVHVGTFNEPYELVWWESKDCGDEIDSLASETPFDYIESHAWSGDRIKHSLDFGVPRLGRRRDDLFFVQGENIDSVVAVTRDGDSYANEVIGLGAGEGRTMLRRTIAVREGKLRRSDIYTDKLTKTSARMDSAIRKQLGQARATLRIESITVANHPNAVIGSWSLGDDILVRAEIPWLGEIAHWARVVSWSLIGEDRAELKLERSDIADPAIPAVVIPIGGTTGQPGYVTSYVEIGV